MTTSAAPPRWALWLVSRMARRPVESRNSRSRRSRMISRKPASCSSAVRRAWRRTRARCRCRARRGQRRGRPVFRDYVAAKRLRRALHARSAYGRENRGAVRRRSPLQHEHIKMLGLPFPCSTSSSTSAAGRYASSERRRRARQARAKRLSVRSYCVTTGRPRRGGRLAALGAHPKPARTNLKRRRRSRSGSSGLGPRTPRCVCAAVPLSGPANHRCASPSLVRAVPDSRAGGAWLPACLPQSPLFLSEP
jgi:hypothetical protein